MGFPWSSRRTKIDPLHTVAPAMNAPLLSEAVWSPEPNDTKVFTDAPKGSSYLEGCSQSGHLSLKNQPSDATFASIAVDIPREIRNRLTRRHILRTGVTLQTPNDLMAFARLNLRHGPDTDILARSIARPNGPCTVDFDLSTTWIGERPLQHAWLDLIFENPSDTTIEMAGMTLSVRPRALF